MSVHGHHHSEEIVIDGVSNLEEPSVGWGWHQHSRKVGLIVGGFFVVFTVLMTFGNHIGNTENIWLVAVALGLAAWMAHSLRPKKVNVAKETRIHELPSDHYSRFPVTGGTAREAVSASHSTH